MWRVSYTALIKLWERVVRIVSFRTDAVLWRELCWLPTRMICLNNGISIAKVTIELNSMINMDIIETFNIQSINKIFYLAGLIEYKLDDPAI